MFFEIFSNGGFPKEIRSEENFSKALILAFEVIVQLPKHTFEIGFFPHYSSSSFIHCALLFEFVWNNGPKIMNPFFLARLYGKKEDLNFREA